MSRFILRPLARKDLRAIWRYSVENWGTVKADSYLRDINQFIARIADRPDFGKSCDHVRTGYFKANMGSHVLFFTHLPDGIMVERVLHQSMDFTRHL
jgi:toxin ParE1/3/4